MPYPDDIGHCSDLFPTAADLHEEARERRAARVYRALYRITVGLEAVETIVESVRTDNPGAEEIGFAERLAAALETVVAAHATRRPS